MSSIGIIKADNDDNDDFLIWKKDIKIGFLKTLPKRSCMMSFIIGDKV